MFENLPTQPDQLIRWDWPQFEPYAEELINRSLTAENVEQWLQDWTAFNQCIDEQFNRLYVATTINTADKDSEERFNHFMDAIYPRAEEAGQKLKEKLLASGLEPRGFEVPLRNMRAEADLFRQENLPLVAEETRLAAEYDRILGAQTVEWEGQERTVSQMRPVYQDPDRKKREKAFRLSAERQLADRQKLNDLWVKFLTVRQKMAANAGKPDYRAFRWQQLLRFDYSPKDCETFHRAIEEAVVPAAERIYARRRKAMGLERLRPWDLNVDPYGRPPLRPAADVPALIERTRAIFSKVDPELGHYFDVMAREGLLDLENRKNKAPGGYCTAFSRVKRPFIFMNWVGVHDDAQTLLHEGGHSFHVFETAGLPYIQQLAVGMEFAEVASMGMELLASPFLGQEHGGYYTPADASRALVEHLESAILFWPYMAVVDAFQHWVYQHPVQAENPANCDAAWLELWQRFMPGVDWSGLEDALVTGWHRKMHIFQAPFYYVEYGLAQLGAVQVWRNSLKDYRRAVADYRKALALGGTVPLPELYRAAGARLAFDTDTLKEAVALMENQIEELEGRS